MDVILYSIKTAKARCKRKSVRKTRSLAEFNRTSIKSTEKEEDIGCED
jgi:hypothetical protein